MKKLLFAVLFLLITSHVDASNYFVRVKGGNLDQCDGTENKDYSMAITNKKCAVNHFNYIHSIFGGPPTKLKEGDTVTIQAGYRMYMGYGSPNSSTPECADTSTYGCYYSPIPSGVKILGEGWDTGCKNPPILVGVRGLYEFLRWQNVKNDEVRCLDLTDEEDCVGGNNPKACRNALNYTGKWANNGLVIYDTENFQASDINVHGLSGNGISQSRNKLMKLERVHSNRNGISGIESDCHDTTNGCGNPGTTTWIDVECSENGCGETKDGKKINCCTQGQGCYGDGCTIMQNAKAGYNWEFILKNIKTDGNTSDGLDALYVDGHGKINIDKMESNGNVGQALKTSGHLKGKDITLTGNCAENWVDKPYTQNPGFEVCRAAGNTLALAFHKGTKVEIDNLQLLHPQGDVAVNSSADDIDKSQGITCDGTEVLKINGLIEEGIQYATGDAVAQYYASGSDGNGAGKCGQLPLDFTSTIPVPPPVCIPAKDSHGVIICNAPPSTCGKQSCGVDTCGGDCCVNDDSLPCPVALQGVTITVTNGTVELMGTPK